VGVRLNKCDERFNERNGDEGNGRPPTSSIRIRGKPSDSKENGRTGRDSKQKRRGRRCRNGQRHERGCRIEVLEPIGERGAGRRNDPNERDWQWHELQDDVRRQENRRYISYAIHEQSFPRPRRRSP
jgi:hypothetical protein